MTGWTAMFVNPLAQRLGWALLDFLWQGALVAAALASLDVTLRHRSARLRYAVCCAALFGMLLLPLATFARRERERGLAPLGTAFRAEAVDSTAGTTSAPGPPALSGFRTLEERLHQRLAAVQPWFVAAWLAGVAVFSFRLLSGWAAVGRLSREAAPAPAWLEETLARLARRLRVCRPVRLLESAAVAVPSAFGVWRPMLLLPVSAVMGLTPDQLEAVLAHELAHIRRHDYLVNILQTVAETLLFYHPAVWWVSRRIRLERENCCDDLAVEATGDARLYARALCDLEKIRGAAPQLAVAANGGPLWNRILRLFPSQGVSANGTSSWLAGALALSAILTMGTVARLSSGEAQEAAPALQSRATQAAQEASSTPVAAAAVCPAKRVGSPAEPGAIPEPAIAAASPAGSALPEPMIAGTPAEDAKEDDPPEPALAPSRPARHLSPEQLIAFRIHGVTPEFLEGIASLGYTRVSPDTLLSLRIHGVTHEFLAGLLESFGKLPLEKCVQLRIHGVTPEYVRALAAEGLRAPSPDQALAMRIHGVDPEFARGIHSLGFPDAGAEKLIGFRIHGVTPEFVREVQSLGYTSLSADDLIAMRIHGVTPEYIQRMNRQGRERLSVNELLERRIHGIGEEK